MIPSNLPAETNVRLLSALPSDAIAITAMAAEIWPRAYSGIITDAQIGYMLNSMYDPAKLQRELSEEGIRYFWITNHHLRTGFIAVGPVLPGTACALHKCYLLPDYQGSGIGMAAMSALIAILESDGASSLELRVNRNNFRAISFYQKNHFDNYAEDRLEIGEGFVMDDFLMRRPIPMPHDCQ